MQRKCRIIDLYTRISFGPGTQDIYDIQVRSNFCVAFNSLLFKVGEEELNDLLGYCVETQAIRLHVQGFRVIVATDNS